ncbi:MAG: hypothetical protein HY819_20990 [Acidobacteria bacterium]|nr:hypothetical protein [Acidobacteriota bacterium]
MQMLFKVILVVLLVFTSNTLIYGQNLAPNSKEESRERYSVLELNQKIYLIGGLTKELPKETPKRKKLVKQPSLKALSSIEYYDPKANKLVSVTSLPIALYDLAAVTLNNKIYLIGGYNSKAIALNRVYAFNPENNKMTKLAPLPAPRAGLRATVVDGKIYVFGGKTKLPNKEALVYNPENNKWKKLAPMSTPREQVALNVVDGKILVAGGKGLKNLSLTTFEEYDIAANKWKQLTPLLNPRVNATALALNNKLYLVGGYKVNGIKQEPITNIEVYDPLTKIWKTLPSLVLPENIVGASISEKELHMFTNEAKIFALNTSQLILDKENKNSLSTTNSTTNRAIDSTTVIANPITNLNTQAISTPTATAPSITRPQATPTIVPIAQPTPIPSARSTPQPTQPPVQTPSQVPTRATNKAPIIYKINNLSARIGQEVCFTPQIADPENDPITLSCTLPSNIKYTIEGNTICLKPISSYRGNSTAYVIARDSFGNQSKQAFYLDILENHRPTFSYIHQLASTLTLYAGQRKEIDIQATDIDASTDPNQDGRIALSLITAPSFVELIDYGYGRGKLIFYPQTNWNSNNNQVVLEVRDFGYPALTSELRFYINVKQPNRPPIVPPIPDITLRAGETLRIPINIYDPDGDYFRVEFKVNDYSFRNILQYLTGQLLLNTPYNSEGRFRATLIATDSVGNYQEESFYVNVVINHAPTLEPVYNIEVEENTQKQVTIRANDIDRNRDNRADGYLTLNLTEHPSFVDFYDQGNGQATITIKPKTGDAGSENRKKYTVGIEARDSGSPSLKANTSFVITVVAPNSPPIIRGIPDQIIRIRGGEQYCVDFVATDPDNDRLDIDVVSNQQQYVYTSNNRICVQPASNFAGRIKVDVIAKDSRGKSTQKSFVVESFINHQPVFEKPSSNTTITVEEEQTLSLKIRATDKDSDRDSSQDGRVELTLAQAPRFVTFSNDGGSGGSFLIRPEAATAGNYTIEIVATDYGSPRLSASLSFQLTVTPRKITEPPIISSVRFESQRLVILGNNFIEDCIVEINGQQFSAGFLKLKESRLVLTGKRKALNLVVGQNNIVVISGNRRSSPFNYHLDKSQLNIAEESN